MATLQLSSNLKRIRHHCKLTQPEVAEKAGLSLAAYRKIESGVSEPRVNSLQAIAKALSTNIPELLLPVQQLSAVRFRSSKKLRSREQILAQVGTWSSNYHLLEKLLHDYSKSKLPATSKSSRRSTSSVEELAMSIRSAFGIRGDEPIQDICGLIEKNGIKIGTLRIASPEFFGLSISARDGGPAVVVNTWERISVERWIFTTAHELGHLVMHDSDYDAEQKDEEARHEQEANQFASYFLMPRDAFLKEWDEPYGLAFLDRVLKVKRLFKVSYKTILYRLVEEKKADSDVWASFHFEFKRKYGRSLLHHVEPNAISQDAFRSNQPAVLAADEPEGVSKYEFPGDRYSRLVRKAVEESHISLSRAAEMIGCSLSEMRQRAATWVA